VVGFYTALKMLFSRILYRDLFVVQTFKNPTWLKESSIKRIMTNASHLREVPQILDTLAHSAPPQ
jgi:hypothetical protein